MKIIVVGGGTTGWISLAYLAATTNAELTIIHSEEVDSLGVGESTTPTIKHVADTCGIDEVEWMKDAKASFKYGIEFINFNKEFLGKDALQKRNIKSKCVTLLIDGPKDCDPWGREAIYKDGETIGRLTSGGYSVFFEKSIGMGYVDKIYANIGEKLKIKMLNQLWPATIVEDSPYDQNNSKIRNRN